jgi:hypothetical protein
VCLLARADADLGLLRSASGEEVVQQECCVALANLSYRDAAAAAAIKDAGAVAKVLRQLRWEKGEDINQEKLFALQDAACGTLLNMLLAGDGVGQGCAEELTRNDAKDVLAKFIHKSNNEQATSKAAKILGKLGVKGVGTKGQFFEKIRTIVTGFIVFKIVQGFYWHIFPDGDGSFDLIFSIGRDFDAV